MLGSPPPETEDTDVVDAETLARAIEENVGAFTFDEAPGQTFLATDDVVDFIRERTTWRPDPALRAEIERLRGIIAAPAVPDSGWTDSQWVEWSNDVASEMPEEWDSDEGQEAIILRFVKYATVRLAERPSEAEPSADTERRVRMIRRVDDYLESHRATDSTRLLGEVRDELVRLSGLVAAPQTAVDDVFDSTGSVLSTHARGEAAYALRLLGVEPTRARIDHILSSADQTATGWSDLPLRLKVIETLQRWLPDAAANEAWENGLAPLLAPGAETEVFDEVRITYPLGVNGDRHATARVYAHDEDPVRKLHTDTEDNLGCYIKVTKVETRTVTTTRTHWKST